jgi:hypothetical protein
MKTYVERSIKILVIIAILSSVACSPVSFSSKKAVTVDPAPTNTTLTIPGGTGGTTKTRDVTFTKKVEAYDNQVDLLIIADDSNSMLEDEMKLQAKMTQFLSDLSASGLNWQMCLTNTSAVPLNGRDAFGASFDWSGLNSHVMLPTNTGIADILGNTVKSLFYLQDTGTYKGTYVAYDKTNDERGIFAGIEHIKNKDVNNCYRKDAAQAVILISDEDERSVGGDVKKEIIKGETVDLVKGEDFAADYVSTFKQAFGDAKKLTFNSIIVKPNDKTCEASQDKQKVNGFNQKSHEGFQYAALSELTGGYVGSICDEDYSANLKYFKEKIQNSMAQLTLECPPVGNVTVTISPVITKPTYKVQDGKIIFEPAIPENHTVTLKYQCAQ